MFQVGKNKMHTVIKKKKNIILQISTHVAVIKVTELTRNRVYNPVQNYQKSLFIAMSQSSSSAMTAGENSPINTQEYRMKLAHYNLMQLQQAKHPISKQKDGN